MYLLVHNIKRYNIYLFFEIIKYFITFTLFTLYTKYNFNFCIFYKIVRYLQYELLLPIFMLC